MGSDARMGATARHGGSCLQEAAGRSVWKGAGAACHLHGKNKGRPWRQPEVRGPKDKGLTQLLLRCGREACCAEGDRYPVLGEPGDRWG